MKKVPSAVIGLHGLLAASAVFATTADDMRGLLEQDNPRAAYQLARANAEQMGDPAFDFYYGIAAIEAGRAGEGVLALERYLLKFPDNGSARFQLAKAYFILGEDQSAREEFTALLPAAKGKEKAAIERYLDAIRTRESRYRPSASFFVDAGIGYDSNINSGIDAGSSVSLPGGVYLPPLASNAVSEKEAAPFYTVGAGVNGAYPLQPGLTLVGSASVDTRRFLGNGNDMFDQIGAGGSGGVSYLSGKNLYRASIAYGELWVDDQAYVQNSSLGGEWAYQLDQFNRLNVGLSYSRQVFDKTCVYSFKNKTTPCVPTDNTVRDADISGLTLGWARAFVHQWQPVLNVALSYADEKNQQSRTDLSRQVHGVRVQAAATPVANYGAGVGLGYQQSKYGDNFFGTSEARKDDVITVDVFASYFYNKQLSVRADLQWTQQDSNVGLFDYDRTTVGVKARYEFK